MKDSECEEFQDFKYKDWNCTVIKYKWKRPKMKLPEGIARGIQTYLNGWWCGYVMVPKEYRHEEEKYNLWNDDLDVHGGITYTEKFHFKESKNRGKYAIGFSFANYHDDGGSKKLAMSNCKYIVKQILQIYLDAEHDLKEANILE